MEPYSATITVDEVSRGEKSTGLKCEGKWFKVQNRMVNYYTVGRTYQVEVEPSEFNGKWYHWIKNAPKTAASAPQPATPHAALRQAGAIENERVDGAASSNWQRPAPPIGHNGNGYSNKDVQIAAIALMKSFIEGGQFGLTDLDALIKACVPAARQIVRVSAHAGPPYESADPGGFDPGDRRGAFRND